MAHKGNTEICVVAHLFMMRKCIEVEHMVNIANRDTFSTEIYFQQKYIFNRNIFSTEIYFRQRLFSTEIFKLFKITQKALRVSNELI